MKLEAYKAKMMNRRDFLQKAAFAGMTTMVAGSGLYPLRGYGSASGAAQKLYNGIGLPTPWPPVGMDIASAKPMPVPYLKARPEVVPIDLGRQLFTDDFLVEDSDLVRKFYRPEENAANPVFKPETSYEVDGRLAGSEGEQSSVCYLGHGGVFFDPQENHYKMFYTAGWRGGLALAVSKDLVNWERVDLGNGRGNIILPAGDDQAGGDNCVWLDTETGNPDERYKLMTTRGREKPGGAFIHTLHTSPDGIHWSEGVRTGPASDYCSFFYNPFRKVWVYSIKQNGPRGRCRYYAESKNFLHGADWKDSVYWVNADELDTPDRIVNNPAQLYSLNAVAYESLLLGMFYIHRGPHNRICEEGKFPKITDLSVGFSRDGFHWDRPDRKPFLAASRKEGDWNRAYLHSTAGVCLVSKDKLAFPYTGYSGVAADGSRGMYTGASIGIAYLRRDGFAAMTSGNEGGYLTSRPVQFAGRQLFVNVNCARGELKAEVLNLAGKVLDGYSAEDCMVLSTDSTKQQISWKGRNSLPDASAEPVRFRFYLRNGELYSFWVSADEAGASGGYPGGA